MPHVITDDGVVLHYSIRGGGPLTVICLHCMGGCAADFDRLAEALPPALYRVIALDVRGHGESDARPVEFSPQRLIRDVLHLANAVGAQRFAVLGHSFGGKVALALAAREPDRIAGLVLLAPVGPGRVPFERETVATILQRAHDAAFIADCFRSSFRPDREAVVQGWARQFARTPVWAHQAVCELAMWTDLSAQIGVIAAPALVVAGSHDPIYGLTYQRASVVPCLTQATLVAADCGHGMMMESVQEVADLCHAFLERLAGLPSRGSAAPSPESSRPAHREGG